MVRLWSVLPKLSWSDSRVLPTKKSKNSAFFLIRLCIFGCHTTLIGMLKLLPKRLKLFAREGAVRTNALKNSSHLCHCAFACFHKLGII